MFALEVKDVDGQPNVSEIRIVLNHLRKSAVVVIEYMIWHCTWQMVNSFDHFLDQ